MFVFVIIFMLCVFIIFVFVICENLWNSHPSRGRNSFCYSYLLNLPTICEIYFKKIIRHSSCCVSQSSGQQQYTPLPPPWSFLVVLSSCSKSSREQREDQLEQHWLTLQPPDEEDRRLERHEWRESPQQ